MVKKKQCPFLSPTEKDLEGEFCLKSKCIWYRDNKCKIGEEGENTD